MRKMTLSDLEFHLWGAADILRGKIDSSDYKHYIFGLLFYKRLCDVWDDEYEDNVKKLSGASDRRKSRAEDAEEIGKLLSLFQNSSILESRQTEKIIYYYFVMNYNFNVFFRDCKRIVLQSPLLPLKIRWNCNKAQLNTLQTKE